MPEGASNKGGLFLFFCLGLIAGVALLSLRQHVASPEYIDFYAGQKIVVLGTVINEPTVDAKNQEFDIRVSQFDDGQSISGNIRVRAFPFPRLNYGDYVKVSCALEKPENKTFNYQRYLARFDVYAVCFRANLEKTNEWRGNRVKKWILDLKQRSLSTIELYIGEPESSLIGPVLFGGGDEIGDEILEQFRRTGLTHIMAVSGFNVGILAAGVAYALFLMGLRRRLVFIFASIVVVFYVIMVGAPSSAVRSGIMAIMIMFALAVGRSPRLISVVIITAAATLIVNPLLLAADIGWQLSFAAVLGLIYLHPPIKKLLDIIMRGKFSALGDIIAATLAAQLSTTPISLFHFGQVSLISPLSNILVVWSIPFLTAASAFALPLAALIPSLGNFFFFPSFIIGKYIIWIVQILAEISWSSIDIS